MEMVTKLPGVRKPNGIRIANGTMLLPLLLSTIIILISEDRFRVKADARLLFPKVPAWRARGGSTAVSSSGARGQSKLQRKAERGVRGHGGMGTWGGIESPSTNSNRINRSDLKGMAHRRTGTGLNMRPDLPAICSFCYSSHYGHVGKHVLAERKH